MSAVDLCYLTITEAASLLRARSLSPVELVQAVLERIERVDSTVKAYLHLAPDQALAEAHEAERDLMNRRDRGPLRGIPLAIKDIVDVADMPTTAGSRVLAGNVAANDAPLVAALRSAGAIVVGKTNTHEFAYGVMTAPTRNPWNIAHIPGGSSGGSAAALAAGMALGAVGTDTAGSIRLPAALCAIVGLKPTYGRVSTRGVIPLSWSLDHAGPMARSVADAALLCDIMTGAPHASLSGVHDGALNRGAPAHDLDRTVRGLRAGIPRAYFYERLSPDVAAAVEAALVILSDLGIEAREVALPDVDLTFAVGRAVQRPEASAYHRARLRATPELYGAEIRHDLELGELFLATDYVHAQRMRAELRERWLEAMSDVDVLMTPTVPEPAPPVTDAASSGGIKGTLLRNTYPFNLPGFPALSLPCGLTPQGLPIGLQIAGRPYDEATVLRIGSAYEAATEWHTLRPPVPSVGVSGTPRRDPNAPGTRGLYAPPSETAPLDTPGTAPH